MSEKKFLAGSAQKLSPGLLEVKFNKKFDAPPVVVVTPAIQGNVAVHTNEVVSNVTREGFNVVSSNTGFINWIALESDVADVEFEEPGNTEPEITKVDDNEPETEEPSMIVPEPVEVTLLKESTVAELRKMAKAASLEGYQKMKKDDLVKLIAEAS